MQLVLLNVEQEIDSKKTFLKPLAIGSNLIFVNNVAQLEAAVAAQTAGQFIVVAPGSYQLTAELVPIFAATGGGIILMGDAEILGLAAADSAISIVGTGADATFEYTLAGEGSFKGGLNKPALKVTNPAISQKTILYVKDSVHFEDNGTGIAVSAVNTGTGAIRMYVTCKAGTGWDTVEITNKNADDKWHFKGVNFDEGLTAAAVDIADNWLFQDCQIAHAGMEGGHATNVCNVVNCFTIETADVAAVDAADFPDGFSPVIVDSVEGDVAIGGTLDVTGISTFTEPLRTLSGVGAVGASEAEAREYGDGKHHVTEIALTDFIVGPLAGAGAALTLVPPTVLYTLPAGAQVLSVSYAALALTAVGTAVTPEMGVGSVIGDGSANATIGAAGATMEDILEGFDVADTDTHAEVASGPVGATAGILTGIALNKAADAKTLYLNCAGTWNADNTGNLTVTGYVTIVWDSIV